MRFALLYDNRFMQPALLENFRDYILATEPDTEYDVLIRWGNVNGQDQSASVIFNRKQPLKNCFDKATVFEILRINRIRRPHLIIPQPDSKYPLIGKFFETGGTQRDPVITDFAEAQRIKADFYVECINTVKKYNLYIFDHNIFCITKKMAVRTHTGPGGGVPKWAYEEIPGDIDQDVQKVSRLAIRAMHALGLDFGMVHAGLDTRGRAIILDVTPTPVMTERLAGLFRWQVDNFLNRNSPENPVDYRPEQPGAANNTVLLGADPEFMLRDTISHKIIYPSDFLDREGILGYDERSENREGQYFPLAEIRPEPDPCPIRLTEKIRDILGRAAKLIPPHIEWLGGSLHFEQYQIGGHIHLSNISISSRLLRVLDNYLAIPIMLIEDPVSGSLRRRQYGWLGSIRSKPHGGFEYRTPASWLVSPEMTRGCLCLAKIVVTEHPSLSKDFFTSPEMQKAFYQSKKHLFYDIFYELWEDITATYHYGIYATNLAPIYNLIHSRSHWDENVDLRKTWGLI